MNQNGSNLVQVLLSNISSYAENPGIFNFFKDSLMYIVLVSNFFFAIVLFQKTANELCLGGSYGSLGFAKKMYLNTFLDSRTTVCLL